jgi:hypothetical protein
MHRATSSLTHPSNREQVVQMAGKLVVVSGFMALPIQAIGQLDCGGLKANSTPRSRTRSRHMDGGLILYLSHRELYTSSASGIDPPLAVLKAVQQHGF